MRSRHRRQTKVDHGPDHDDVAERAEAGLLAQRNPESEHYRADDDRPGADPKPEPAREALVEHIPRIDPESREQHERVTEAVEREARVKLAEATQPRRRHQTPRLTADHSWSCTCNPWVHRLALKHFTAAPDLRPYTHEHWGSCLTCIAVCPFTKPNTWWRTAAIKALTTPPIALRPYVVRALKAIDDKYWGVMKQKRVRWMGYDSGIKPGEQACTVAGCTAEHGAERAASTVGNVGYYAPLKENTNRFVKRDV